MASQDDFLTTQKNGVTAINGLNTTIPKWFGQFTSVTVTAATVIVTGPGRLVKFAVLVAGSAGGIYNSASTTTTAASQLAATPATVGIYDAGLFFTNGLTIVPGSGQSVNVTYSQG